MPTYRNQPVDVVIDVRSKVEFWLGHLEGAVCVPIQTVPDAVPDLPGVSTASRILVYCASGGRSAMAADALRSMGYIHVVDGGGIGDARAHFEP